MRRDHDHLSERQSLMSAGLDPELFPQVLLRRVRVVPVGDRPAPEGLVDVRMRAGRIVALAPRLPHDPADGDVHDADGRWAIPGLWDHHVHLAQWADTLARVDMSGTASPDEVLERLRVHLAELAQRSPGGADSVVIGFGHRSAVWARQPTVAELDAVSGHHPVVLVSGDAHNGWLNSAALALLGAPATDGALSENDWFPVMGRLQHLPGSREARDTAYRLAVSHAAALGIVGVGDMEFGDGFLDWPRRFAGGVRDLRVRVATYPEGLDAVLDAGLRSGDVLGDSGGLVRMGPLKIISDGSLNTRTAYCDSPYAGAPGLADPCGRSNYSATDLTGLVTRGHAAGLRLAIHAIGDAAVALALDVFASVGAAGTIEHAQLMRPADVPRMARLGIAASVQPAHLLDDRDVTAQCWPDRADRCFPLRSMVGAGVTLLLGSDAPVAALDPWLAMAAAVHRSADAREPWNPAEALTVALALAASTDRQQTLTVGSRADVVLLDADPLGQAGDKAGGAGPDGMPGAMSHRKAASDGVAAASAAAASRLRAMPVAATYLGGRITFRR